MLWDIRQKELCEPQSPQGGTVRATGAQGEASGGLLEVLKESRQRELCKPPVLWDIRIDL